jgi:hypothetical protein
MPHWGPMEEVAVAMVQNNSVVEEEVWEVLLDPLEVVGTRAD